MYMYTFSYGGKQFVHVAWFCCALHKLTFLHFQMPHETQPVPVDELFRVASPLSSLLASKISAKKNAKRSTKKVGLHGVQVYSLYICK